MKLEQQVVSLELAKRLKELGMKQNGALCWMEHIKSVRMIALNIEPQAPQVISSRQGQKILSANRRIVASAFTVAEIGEMIGSVSEKDLIRAYGYVFNVPDTRFISATGLQDCMSRPDVGAKMLIYLLENKLITL